MGILTGCPLSSESSPEWSSQSSLGLSAESSSESVWTPASGCVSYIWLMLSPWIICTLTLPPLLASLIPRTFHRYHTPTIYLPQNSHHTYLSWHFHSHSEIYCHATFHRSIHMTHITFVILLFAWTCSWHCICGKATFIIFIHVALDSLHIPVNRRRHSYRVISCSKYRVVIVEL